jgi:hypothetical protein
MLFSQNTIKAFPDAAECEDAPDFLSISPQAVSFGGQERRMVDILSEESLGQLRVLYLSDLTPEYYGEYWHRALKRLPLGHVAALDYVRLAAIPGLAGKLQFRLQAGPGVRRLNRAVLQAARREQANVLLCDKVLSLQPATLRRARQQGMVAIDHINDNPFGPRRDPGWRLFRKTIPEYDLHAVPRSSSVADFRERGAREVMEIRFAYEPTVHYAPSVPWGDAQRDRNVSFIGTPYDQRGAFLTRLWRAGVAVDISGSRAHWQAALPADAFAAAFRVGELKGDAYREAIWRSRINLAFVTHSNRDQVAHKSFEITACGGFLLAERTPEHVACFREDEEAVFFSDFEECRAKIDRYRNDEVSRARIAAAGQRRAGNSGYDNDSVLRRLLTKAAEMQATRMGN